MDNKTLKSRSTVRTFTAEVSAEQDFIVPDIKPDIKKVLKLTAVPIVHQTDSGQGRLNLSGDLLLYLCYLPEDGATARAMELRLPFSDVLEPGMCDTCLPEVTVRRATCSLLNGRKVNVRVTLGVTCTLTETQELTVLCPSEDENVRMLEEPLTFCETVPVSDRTVEFSEHLELPAHSAPIRELLSVDPVIVIQEYQALSGRIAVSGVVRIETLYLPDTEPCRIARMEHELPFTEVLDADGLQDSGTCRLSAVPCRFEVGLYEDADGDARLVGVRFSFRLIADACNCETCDAAVDAFGVKTPVTLKTARFSGVCTCQQETLSHPIREPLPVSGVLEVCSIRALPKITETAVDGNCITYHGELAVTALILCEPNGEAECLNAAVPFTVTQEMECGCSPNEVPASATCDHVGYTLQPNGGLELRTTVKILTTLLCCADTEVLSDITPCEEETSQECRMVVYFTRDGDRLWDVAKRYHSCPKRIAALNELSDDGCLAPNQALLIP